LIVLNFLFESNDEISSLDFYQIYIILRHPHHYLPSSYFSFDVLFKLIINIISLAFIYFFSKNLVLRNFIKLSFIFVLLLHLVQFVAVEFLNVKILSIIGITRLSGAFNFFYLAILLSFFFEKLSKLNLNFGFLSYYNFQKLSFFYLIFIFFFFIYHYNYSSNKISVDSSRNLELILKNEFLIEDIEVFIEKDIEKNFLFLREIGHLNVFQDDYFPFSTKSMVVWNERRNLKQQLFDSQFSNSVLLNQVKTMIINKNIIIVTKRKLFNLSFVSNLKLKDNSNVNIYYLSLSCK
jgi:hypothetical protein